jgi:hypothetical protein
MRSPYYQTREMERMGKEALHQLYDESMPIKQVVVTLISRRKSNVLRIIDPELVSKIVEFLQQRYRKVD